MRLALSILFAIIGAVLGFLVYLRIPDTYRSTTRLMIEQDTAQVFDDDSEADPSAPLSFDMLQSQLFSDQCIQLAFDDPRMQPFRERYNGNPTEFMSEVQSSLLLEREVDGNPKSLVVLLHYSTDDPELAEATVRSFLTALQKFLNDAASGSKSDRRRQVVNAMQLVQPKLAEMEQRYYDFRRDAPLIFDVNGKAINPHQERVSTLKNRRNQLSDEMQQKQIAFTQVQKVAKEATNPTVALQAIKKMLKIDSAPSSNETPEEATEAIASLIFVSKSEVDLLREQIGGIEEQISKEEAAAKKLAKYESENTSMMREIDRNQQLLDELDSQLTKINLANSATTNVVELTSPTRAYLVGPILAKYVLIGIVAGFLFGLFLALLIGPGRRGHGTPEVIITPEVVQSE